MDNKANNLTSKERMELFQASVNKFVQENEVKSIRQLLHERYLEAKAQEEKRKTKSDSLENKETHKEKKTNGTKIGRQLAKVFRFKTTQPRNRRHQRLNHDHEIDPLLNDPNVLFENFAFDDNDQDDEGHNEDLPFFPEDPSNIVADEFEDDMEDDSFKSLIFTWLQRMTWLQITSMILWIVIYICGQKIANSYDFGAPFFILALLIFIFINLRRKAPGELSAYSVFNPNCKSIPTVASSEQPREQILLGFGPL